jgi:2-octaprenylphenol hydroxylase
MNTQHSDVIILGGAMVGAAAALALSQLGLRVSLLETHPVNRDFDSSQPYSLRISAIQRSSEKLLKSLGVWDAIIARRIMPFTAMHIEDWQGFHSLLSAHDLHEPNLGHIIENDVLTAAIWDSLSANSNCQIHSAKTTQAQQNAQGNWQIQLDNGTQLHSPLLIGADGAHSQVRAWLGLTQDTNDYQQHCIVGNVQSEKAHKGQCWQHYGEQGIFALLPLSAHTCSIAWYVSPEQVPEHCASSHEQQASAMTVASAGMLGQLTPISELQAFPLVRRQTQHYAQANTLLIGDAAHTVHPQAGQGVNLGLLDVIALRETCRHAIAHEQPLHDMRVLSRIERARKHDATLVQRGMESINWLFSDSTLTNRIRHLVQPLAKQPNLTMPLTAVTLYGRLTGLGQ